MDSVLDRPSLLWVTGMSIKHTTIFYLQCACICDRESPCVYVACAYALDFEVMNFCPFYECVG